MLLSRLALRPSSLLLRSAPAAGLARGVKVYTKTGDAGTSSLFNGERRPKDDVVFAALGDTDELNAAIGLARAHCELLSLPSGALTAGELIIGGMLPQLDLVQSRLLDVGSAIATPRTSSSEARVARTAFDEDGAVCTELEGWIDHMDEELPALKNFILPSGGVASASLHVARATCRRAERAVVPLCQAGDCDAQAAVFLNRLSDYLFVSARYVAMHSNKPETVYRKPLDGTRDLDAGTRVE